LPYWLRRIRRGGRVLAPGPADQPWRFVDVRDLAAWLLDAVTAGVSGPVNLVGPPGHATTGALFAAAREVTGGDAEFVWLEPEQISAVAIARHDELPGWIPPGPRHAGLIDTNVDRALATGLRCRPVRDTVADTWAWLVAAGHDDRPGPDEPPLGFAPGREADLLRKVST
jgi:2'-hydroxyisoflavone reductase